MSYYSRRGPVRSRLYSAHQPMTLEQIQGVAPSVFADKPWSGMNEDTYRFIPTVRVVEHLMTRGLVPVQAEQNRVRIPGKEEFTRHAVRFQLPADMIGQQWDRGEAIPEVVLRNAHDGTGSYVLYAGLFRFLCLNGLMVSDGTVQCIRTRHSGRKGIVENVTDASFEIIDRFPTVARRVNTFRNLQLTQPQRIAFAAGTGELSPSSLDIDPHQLLIARRHGDDAPNLWNTMNVIQENVIKGGIVGASATGKRRATKAVTSIDTDLRFNRALWRFTEEIARQLA